MSYAHIFRLLLNAGLSIVEADMIRTLGYLTAAAFILAGIAFGVLWLVELL